MADTGSTATAGATIGSNANQLPQQNFWLSDEPTVKPHSQHRPENKRNFASSRGKRPNQPFRGSNRPSYGQGFRTFHRSQPRTTSIQSEVSEVSVDTPSVDSIVQKPKKQRVCKYFKTDGSCYYGDKCKFLHYVAPKQSQNAEKPQKEASPPAKHTAVKRTIVRPVRHILHADQLHSDEQKQSRNAEINYFKRRFSRVKIDQQDGATRIEFLYTVTDPDWVFEVQTVTFVLTIPEDYPLESPKLDILQDRLPKPLHSYLVKKFNEIIETKFLENVANDTFENMGKWFIRQIDRNIMELFTVGLKRTKWLLDAERAGIKVVLPEEISISKSHTSVDQEDSDNEVLYEEEERDEDQVGSSTDSDDEDDVDGKSSSKLKSMKENMPPCSSEDTPSEPSALIDVRVNWTDLSQNIATLTAIFVHISIRCLRCSGTDFTECPSGKPQTLRCKRCQTGQSIRFDSILAHQNSNLIGKVLPKGCRPVDCVLLKSKLRFLCLNCNKDCDVEALSYGQPHKSWCFNCHTRCEFVINSINFSGNFTQIAKEDTSVPKIRKTKEKEGPMIIAGQPLPKQGTCKHYGKSYRWFRFPCCGKLYPCDQCHNEAELGDHEMKLANRMVCGFCSKEQPFGQSCTNCTGFVTRIKTSHWEGGKGCRNKVLMSSKDEKKYKNSGTKTVPTKRTGQDVKKVVANKK